MKGVYLGDMVKDRASKRAGKVVEIDAALNIHVERAVGGRFQARFEDLEVLVASQDRKEYLKAGCRIDLRGRTAVVAPEEPKP